MHPTGWVLGCSGARGKGVRAGHAHPLPSLVVLVTVCVRLFLSLSLSPSSWSCSSSRVFSFPLSQHLCSLPTSLLSPHISALSALSLFFLALSSSFLSFPLCPFFPGSIHLCSRTSETHSRRRGKGGRKEGREGGSRVVGIEERGTKAGEEWDAMESGKG